MALLREQLEAAQKRAERAEEGLAGQAALQASLRDLQQEAAHWQTFFKVRQHQRHRASHTRPAPPILAAPLPWMPDQRWPLFDSGLLSCWPGSHRCTDA